VPGQNKEGQAEETEWGYAGADPWGRSGHGPPPFWQCILAPSNEEKSF